MSTVQLNSGFRRMFAPDKMTIGVFFAIESYKGDTPVMSRQVELARRAEQLGFAALWFRDVPLRDPGFGDVGQIYDPWVYLGYIVAHTSSIALATGSIIFPIRHPLHLAKAAASVDRLSQGRLVLGIASGDRPVEYPAFGIDFATRGERFRETLRYFREVLENSFPTIASPLGQFDGIDLIPKPYNGCIPILVTGNSQQSLPWLAENADGWVYYPRRLSHQEQSIKDWRRLTQQYCPDTFKPFTQSLYIDLANHPDATPEPIHLGFRLGRNRLIELLYALQDIGVNHVVLNLKYGNRPAAEVLEEVGEEVLPRFAAHAQVAEA